MYSNLKANTTNPKIPDQKSPVTALDSVGLLALNYTAVFRVCASDRYDMYNAFFVPDMYMVSEILLTEALERQYVVFFRRSEVYL